MFISDTKMVQIHYEDRLREAAQERFAQQMVARSPMKPNWLLEKLGDLFIAAGTTLINRTNDRQAAC